jgi:para-aminobenzoate synthetase/4-amino-4-deoxychorismate lyase
MTLAGRRCRPQCVDLGPGPSPEELLRRVADWDGLVGLRGAWAGADALLTSHPLLTLPADTDPIAALDDRPVLDAHAPFVGGGWFGRIAFDGPSALAFHDHVVRLVDGRWQFESLASDDRATELARRLDAWRAALATGAPAPAWRAGPVTGPPEADHLAAVERAVELIRAGELYQVNVCTRLHGSFTGSPAAFFADTAAALDPRYGAFLAGAPAIVSLSPELFLRRRGRDVVSVPIKGTLPRGDDDAETAGNEAALRRSAKDAAENVMIVDLVRNDLGRVCETGSVRAAALLDVEPHPGVWHLVSTVAGRLRRDVGDSALLRATFPPGSVTGAPKLRALEAIGALEPVARGTYTGAIGFVSPLWGAEFNVAIRTFEIGDGRLELGVGGGITADSVPVLEWRECGHKAAPLLAAAGADAPDVLPGTGPAPVARPGGLLETVLAVDGVPLRAADHLARLDRSCRELYRAGRPAGLTARVIAAAASVPAGRAAVRVVVTPDLAAEVTAAPIGPPPQASELTVRSRPGGSWRHKWADRTWAVDRDDAIFVAPDGAVLETVRGNVFLIEADGTLVTPPLRDDLLPGVTRRALLDAARDAGRPTALRAFGPAELRRRPAFWTSSLSGAVPVHRLDGVDLPRADAVVAELARTLVGGNSGVR